MKKEPSVMSPQGSGDSQNGSIDQRGEMKKDPLRPRAVPWYEMGLLSLDVITIQQL